MTISLAKPGGVRRIWSGALHYYLLARVLFMFSFFDGKRYLEYNGYRMVNVSLFVCILASFNVTTDIIMRHFRA